MAENTLSALLVDAGNTLLQLREPVGETYARLGAPYGVSLSGADVDRRFRRAFRLWQGPRYQGDGRPFWRAVVREATTCDDPDYFEAVYGWYARAEAWGLAEGALDAFGALRRAGTKVAVVSNWDSRLRPLLGALGVLSAVDAAFISCELGLEKPDPAIYRLACEGLGVLPAAALHVGDHPGKDAAAARAAGCGALLWGAEVKAFHQLANPARRRRLLANQAANQKTLPNST